ncbi:MAG: hypothetical protein HKN15_07165 [Xanthomonadales bacterium]|nr:hypothetical protein [Xanthomonadales bacterium]
MSTKIDRVDAYIASAADYARPLLLKLRDWVHDAAPEIEEDIKWGMPAFMHKGIVANMAAFKKHVSFGFWKGQLMKDPAGLFDNPRRTQITAFKLRTLDDLPAREVFAAYLREAIELNERGVKLPVANKNPEREVAIPEDLSAALKNSPDARSVFESLSYTHRKEYVDWLNEAKRDATRTRRLETAIEWISQGKPRNWKYNKR